MTIPTSDQRIFFFINVKLLSKGKRCASHIIMMIISIITVLLFIISISCIGLNSSGATFMFLPDDQFHENNSFTPFPALQSAPTYSINRKLFTHGICTNRDISISQSEDSTSGIPQYIVQIVNTCLSGCDPSNVHLHCGWFASARMVNPKIFKRVSYDDCLVNAGRPLKTSQLIRFTYSNFMYPLSFKSAKFC